MFTGIVEEIGTVEALEFEGDSARLTIRGPLVTSDAGHGDSISVNGVCLTVTDDDAAATGAFRADVMGESLRRSSLGALREGSPVNLERAMRADDRFGGHIVQGHVDAVGEVVSRIHEDGWDVVRVSVPEAFSRYTVEKGSITLDGVSLTISGVSAPGESPAWLEVSLIPTTLEKSTLGAIEAGSPINLEFDVVAKYVERMTAFARD